MTDQENKPRVVILLDTAGYFTGVVSDEPVRAYTVDEGAPSDRVYQLTDDIGIKTGVEHVTAALGQDPVGHMNDNTVLGSGTGERHSAARPAISVVSDGPIVASMETRSTRSSGDSDDEDGS